MPDSAKSSLPAFAAAVAIAIAAGCGSESTPAVDGGALPAIRTERLAPELRILVRSANQLRDGGADAFEAQLARLREYPVVVNQWASWCQPCRAEFPFFQRLAAKYAGRVAFLGVNSKDARGDAEAFLREFPLPFPHYYDKDASVARVFGGGRAWPTTAFYNSKGELVRAHLGGYASEAKLAEDIRRYALRG